MGWSLARQLYSRDIYQSQTKHLLNYILFQDHMSSSHGKMKCSLTAVQQRRISAADETYFKSHLITGPDVIITRGEVQPASCTAETYISREENIFQTTFYYRTTCHRHTGWSSAWQLYSRDIYQTRTKHISSYILLQDHKSSSHGAKCSLAAVQQRHISAADKQATFYYRTTSHRHTGWSAAWQLYSRDIYQPRRNHLSEAVSLRPLLEGTACNFPFGMNINFFFLRGMATSPFKRGGGGLQAE